MIEKFRGKCRFLSNFWSTPIEYEGKVYPSAEHAYQASKSTEDSIKEIMRAAPTPGKAKRLGNKVRNTTISAHLVAPRRR